NAGQNQPSVRATSASGAQRPSATEKARSAQPKFWPHTATLPRLKTAFGKLFANPSPPTVARSLNIRKSPKRIPIKARLRDMVEWKIVRKPVVHPTIATEPAE